MIQLRLKEANLFFGSRLACLRNQKCIIYANRIVTDVPQKEANDSYKALGIICPAEIPVRDGGIVYTPPESGSLPPEKKKRRKKKQDPTTTAKEPTIKVPGKRGRRKGSKNKKTLEREALLAAQGIVPVKRKRGRPSGSKNKKTLEREALMAAQGLKSIKRKPGRPPGSKNKKTLEREVLNRTCKSPTPCKFTYPGIWPCARGKNYRYFLWRK